MVDEADRTKDSRRLKLATSKLKSLSVLPTVMAQAAPLVLDPKSSPVELTDLVSVSPPLAAKALSMAARHGLDVGRLHFNLSQVLSRIPAHLLRQAVLEMECYQESPPDQVSEIPMRLSRTGLIVHSLAVACCARHLADLMVVGTDSNFAYLAGLLHDIGKLALHELMPRGLSLMVGQAQRRAAPMWTIERERLGLDHSVMGRYLAQRWSFTDEMQMVIRLHHSRLSLSSTNMGSVQMAQIVRCADTLVNARCIGESGSYEKGMTFSDIAALLQVNEKSVRDLDNQLSDLVQPKIDLLHLDMADPLTVLGQTSRTGAARLSGMCIELEDKVRQSDRMQMEVAFISDFMTSVDISSDVLDVAAEFACRFQRFYQMGNVCLLWGLKPGDTLFEAVLVGELQQCQTVILECPPGTSICLPQYPDLINDVAHEYDWMFDQVDMEFNRQRCKAVALVVEGGIQARLIFELHYPTDIGLLEETLKTTMQAGGVLLKWAILHAQKESFIDDLMGENPSLRPERPVPPQTPVWDLLAEMAAGLAHELNNPLSVISGRAQLLATNDSGDERQRSLVQIEDNVRDVAGMVSDLLTFAEPPAPVPTPISARQVIEEASELAAYKSGYKDLHIGSSIEEGIDTIFVDSGQIVSALANILVNSIESYQDQVGGIEVFVGPHSLDGYVTFRVCDQGCGMDAKTVEKATTPFFSAKSAGRKRGMGLAYAARVISLNQGYLTIASQVGEGTQVSISLPSAS